jgi:maltooligosyltrehalose trehalohydrolase
LEVGGLGLTAEHTYLPQFGAFCGTGGARFRVLAPAANELVLELVGGPQAGMYPMKRGGEVGAWDLEMTGVRAGQHYRYRIDGRGPFPDPASRFQPRGVHGPSELVDPNAFRWTDSTWSGVSPGQLVVYELHTGTFSKTGTFASVADTLPALRDLGVTAIEIMPIADFAGARNWGYDGGALYAPSRAYGRPDDLRALVDRAHQLGLAVILDVVYNHLGPEGAYLTQFNPVYLLDRATPWGSAVNLDGPGSDLVRRFIVDNAVHWLREYHLDGLRVDATHALIDEGPVPFMREFSQVVRSAVARPILLHAEDYRNLNEIVRNDTQRGWGLDGVWSDDFHHVLRRMVAGDSHSYYADYDGTIDELARILGQGWLHTGSFSKHLQTRRGTDPSAIPMNRFVVCVQNHDQVGNRAFGERLNHQVDEATWRALSVLLLTSPMTPLLFMGQEWSASTPFLFFSDLEPGLGRMVTDGRRQEFRHFPEFSTPGARDCIPDPQSPATFEASRLRWEERRLPSHRVVLELYRELLSLRRREPALQASNATSQSVSVLDGNSIALRREDAGTTFHIVVRLRGEGPLDLIDRSAAGGVPAGQVILTTEDRRFALDPHPIEVAQRGNTYRIEFARPGAIIFRAPSIGEIVR